VRNRILLIILVAVATRAFFSFTYPTLEYYGGISNGYLTLADNVLSGKGFVVRVDVSPIASGTHQWQYLPSIDRPLGYLLIILVPYWLLSLSGIQALQVMLAALSAVLLYRIAATTFSEKVAFLSGITYALWPLSARFEVTLLPDAIMSFFLILAMWLIVRSFKTQRTGTYWLLTGVTLGVGMLVRPDILLLPLFVIGALFLLKETKNQVRSALLLLVGAGIAIMPSAVRNYEVTGGKIVPVGLGNGISLWEGISQFGDTLGTVYGDERMEQREGYRSWAYPDGIERDKARFKEALNIILQHPLWYAGMMGRRIPVLLRPDGVVSSALMPPPKEFFRQHPGASILHYLREYPFGSFVQILLILCQWFALLLALIPVVRKWNDPIVLLSSTVILYYIVIHIGTNTEPRYFYPAIPFVLLLASQGVNVLADTLRKI
jgi:4-amino-4-deoxy-L-arabinose transferase-like glycosyltransferase